MGYLRNYRKPTLACAISAYRTAAELYQQSRRDAGGNWLRATDLLINRLEATVHYLQSLEIGAELVELLGRGTPASCPPEKQAEAARLVHAAIARLELCMAHTGSILPDRASMGTLVSKYQVTHHVFCQMRMDLEGNRQHTETTSNAAVSAAMPTDAPPSPIQV